MAEQLSKNLKFQNRMLKVFDLADRDKDGVLKMADVLKYVETLKMFTKKTDIELDPLRTAIGSIYGAMGVTEEGVRREYWVKNMSHFVIMELERLEKAEKLLMHRMLDSFYDSLDMNEENNLGIQEFGVFVKCFDWPLEVVTCFFAFADKRGEGKIEWNELYDLLVRFWYKLEDGVIDHMYWGHF